MFKYSLKTSAFCWGLETSSPGLALPCSPIGACPAKLNGLLFFFPSQICLCFHFLLHLEFLPSYSCFLLLFLLQAISYFKTQFKLELSRLWYWTNSTRKVSFFLVHAPCPTWGSSGALLTVTTQGPGLWSLYLNMCFHGHHRSRKEIWGNVHWLLMWHLKLFLRFLKLLPGF